MLQNPSILVAALLLFSFVTPCCSDEVEQAHGGNPFPKTEYIWFAGIGEGSEEDMKDFLCGGALISPRHVMTADHCLEKNVLKSLRVKVGYFCMRSDNCGRKFQIRDVMEMRRNPSLGDIAILVLSSRVSRFFVPAVPDIGLPSYLLRIKKEDLIMVSAGREGTFEPVAKRAETLKLQLRHTNYKKCRKAINSLENRKRLISASTICSISTEGKPCRGDSGSPIVVDGGTDGDVIVAVHHYGPNDCSGASDERLLGHTSVSAVASFVISVVCLGDDDGTKENWCPPACTPTLSPPQETAACTAEVCSPFCAPILPLPTGDALEATLVRDLTDHSATVRSVSFDATSLRLASVHEGGKVIVWHMNSGASPQMSFNTDDCCPISVAFNPAGTVLAVDDGSNVDLFDVRNNNNANEPRKLAMGHSTDVKAVAWHPEGNILASGGTDGTVKLWDVATGTVLHTFQGHGDNLHFVCFEPQGGYIASASDRTIRVWNLSTFKLVRTIEGHTSTVWSVACSPDGTKLASGSSDGTIRVWRASDGSQVGVFSVGTGVHTVAWSGDGQFLVSGSRDPGIVHVWDGINGGWYALLELTDHSDFVSSVAWSPDGKFIASGSYDHTVKVWEISTN